jgi:hypothetical protein
MCILEELVGADIYEFFFNCGFKKVDGVDEQKILKSIPYNLKMFTNIGTIFSNSNYNFNLSAEKCDLITKSLITNNYQDYNVIPLLKNLISLEIEVSAENKENFNSLCELDKLELLIIDNAFGYDKLDKFYKNLFFLPQNLKILIICNKFFNFKGLSTNLPSNLEKIIVVHNDKYQIEKLKDKIIKLPFNCEIYHILRKSNSLAITHKLILIE